MITRLIQAALHPEPYRVRLLRPLLKRMTGLPYELRLQFDAVDRPWMGYGILNAAKLAKRLGIPRIAAVEMGVASGAGLAIMQRHAHEIEKAIGVGVDVVGFDMGPGGLPEPEDWRDCPHLWQSSFYDMGDPQKLRERVPEARLAIGDVRSHDWTKVADEYLRGPNGDIMPVGFVACDLDFRSSTLASFKLFRVPDEFLLPRCWLHLDDLINNPIAGVGDDVGQWAAVADWNEAMREEGKKQRIHPDRFMLRPRKVRAQWNNQSYLWQNPSHPLYETFVGTPNDQL